MILLIRQKSGEESVPPHPLVTGQVHVLGSIAALLGEEREDLLERILEFADLFILLLEYILRGSTIIWLHDRHIHHLRGVHFK